LALELVPVRVLPPPPEPALLPPPPPAAAGCALLSLVIITALAPLPATALLRALLMPINHCRAGPKMMLIDTGPGAAVSLPPDDASAFPAEKHYRSFWRDRD